MEKVCICCERALLAVATQSSSQNMLFRNTFDDVSDLFFSLRNELAANMVF